MLKPDGQRGAPGARKRLFDLSAPAAERPGVRHHAHPLQLPPGFTLIELLVGVAVLAIVSTLAWPSYQQHLFRARRTDAHAALARIQQAQERRRSQLPSYTATLGDGGLGLSASSIDGHYALATLVTDETANVAYRVSASASGAQSADTPCRHLAIDVTAGNVQLRSGPSAELANDSASNRRCWNQ